VLLRVAGRVSVCCSRGRHGVATRQFHMSDTSHSYMRHGAFILAEIVSRQQRLIAKFSGAADTKN